MPSLDHFGGGGTGVVLELSLSHILHHQWSTVNLKQLFHHSQRLGSSGHAFCAHSYKPLETSAKMVVPIVKRSSRFVLTHSGHTDFYP